MSQRLRHDYSTNIVTALERALSGELKWNPRIEKELNGYRIVRLQYRENIYVEKSRIRIYPTNKFKSYKLDGFIDYNMIQVLIGDTKNKILYDTGRQVSIVADLRRQFKMAIAADKSTIIEYEYPIIVKIREQLHIGDA